MRRDDEPPVAPPPTAAPWPPPSIGWLEVALPLWRRKWRLVGMALLLGALAFTTALHQPVRFLGQASFVVTPVQRPSQSVVAAALPALAGLAAGGTSAIDLHAAILKSRSVSDRLIERFDLVRAWQLGHPSQARALLARRLDVTVLRREGLVFVEIEDEHPQRAAALANQAVEELRSLLRGFALEEARQRRGFYEAQLQRARSALDATQKQLQASGFDRAALRAEPRATADAYTRQQAEIAAAEVRLAALRQVRADSSPEVAQTRGEIAALRGQLAAMEVPRNEGPGTFVGRLREFRAAEQLVESLSRQVEAARFDEDAEPLPMQWLDRAQPAAWPYKPRPLLWLLAGLVGGFLAQAAWELMRHRGRLARQDGVWRERHAQVLAALPPRRKGGRWPWRRHGAAPAPSADSPTTVA